MGSQNFTILICAETEDEDDETLEFYGSNCTEEFMNHLDDLTVDEHGDERKVICIFHNFKGYDGMFILKYLYDSHRTVENQICIGTKVLSLSTGDITFKDSLCFLSFPLSQFPHTFGIEELAKGFFPHKFNTTENQDYEGVMPSKHFYDPEGMDAKSKAKFDEWYSKKVEEDHTFNMKDEMSQYCISDVKLLKAGCQKFQQQFQEKAEFNPMEKCITIASACNRYWRKMQLPRDTIAVEPPNGWHGATTNQSLKALQWLIWREHKLSKSNESVQADRIKHSQNGGEVMVFTPAQSFRVDGFDELTNTVYKFHGCLWHGCPKCFPRRDAKSFRSERTFGELYEATKAKENMLFDQGYSLTIIWECQWERLKETDASLKEFLSSIEITPPLNPREAFFGGRTNAVSLYAKTDQSKGEQIRYVDVTSLYPWVNKYGEYPTGHPEIITNPENQDLSSYFGIAKVTILPPFELYHPVLPYRCKGKLVFPLCKSCVENQMQKPFAERSEICCHTDEQRALTGTWCTPEIMKAIEMGYTVITVHEVWHFAHKQTGLFSDYVNTWLKIKQESAGYPSEIVTEEEKQEFVSRYKEREHIDLDPQYIVENPGRKATAKLMLNSFWGKFGENLDKPTTASITSTESLFDFVSDPLIKIQQIRICNDELLEMVYSNVKSNQLDNGKRNVFVAAFTTCHARLKLYSYLQKLNKQVLYFDTDSVVYKWQPGQVEIPLGDFLGEMTNELQDKNRPGDYITEFVSGGPKNYGYVTDQGAVCCKVRGFSLKSVRGSSQLNYTILRNNLLKELTDPQQKRRDVKVLNPNFFTRDPASKKIKVIPRTKLYGLVFDKRVVDFDSFVSFPYGFKKLSLDQDDIVMAELLCDL